MTTTDYDVNALNQYTAIGGTSRPTPHHDDDTALATLLPTTTRSDPAGRRAQREDTALASLSPTTTRSESAGRRAQQEGNNLTDDGTLEFKFLR